MRVRKLIVNGEPVPGVQVVKKSIGMPPFKSNLIDVPGANGSLDLSTALTGGFPRYGNRSVSFDLVLVDVPGSADIWAAARAFGRAWHGSIADVTTDDSADSYYRGRATIESFDDDAEGVKFTLALDAEPYRYAFIETEVKLTDGGPTVGIDIGDMPVSPLFTGSATILLIDGDPWQFSGTAVPMAGLVLSPGYHTFSLVDGTPTTMTYRAGWL